MPALMILKANGSWVARVANAGGHQEFTFLGATPAEQAIQMRRFATALRADNPLMAVNSFDLAAIQGGRVFARNTIVAADEISLEGVVLMQCGVGATLDDALVAAGDAIIERLVALGL